MSGFYAVRGLSGLGHSSRLSCLLNFSSFLEQFANMGRFFKQSFETPHTAQVKHIFTPMSVDERRKIFHIETKVNTIGKHGVFGIISKDCRFGDQLKRNNQRHWHVVDAFVLAPQGDREQISSSHKVNFPTFNRTNRVLASVARYFEAH